MLTLSHPGGFSDKCLWYALILILLDHPLPSTGSGEEREEGREAKD